MRELGIPTVLDRFIQQAILQVLQPLFDPTFSPSSYGFRPGRSAHQAILAVRDRVSQGKRFVVDVDLENFFDRVNHDISGAFSELHGWSRHRLRQRHLKQWKRGTTGYRELVSQGTPEWVARQVAASAKKLVEMFLPSPEHRSAYTLS